MGTHGKRRSPTVGAGLLALLVSVAVLSLAACGGSSSTASNSPSAAPSEAAASPSVAASPSATPLPTPTVAGTIVFSRGGKRADGSDDTDICVVSTDGTGLKVLARGKDGAAWPRCSPDGKRIVYERDKFGVNHQEVWVMNADGSGKEQITNDTDSPMTSRLPSWSPDGRQIVFSSWLSDSPERAVVAVMNADGSHFRKVTKPKGASVDYWPTWASDGRIYCYRIDTSGGVPYEYSVEPDGSALTRIMELGSYPQYLLYYGVSPDGRRVALQDETADRLEVLPVGGGKAVTLLDPATDYLGDILAVVGWSPDQKALAIAGLFDNGGTRLYIVNADGTGLSAVPGIDAARDPAWRPE